MAAHSGLVDVSCTNFGGDPTLSWIIEVDTGSRGEPTGKTVNVEGNSRDMYLPSKLVFYSYLLTAFLVSSLVDTIYPTRAVAGSGRSALDTRYIYVEGVFRAREDISWPRDKDFGGSW
jgi:hypothetical protein